MRPIQATLTEWPAPVMMRRCDGDPLAQVLRELDRLELCIDGLVDIDEDTMPPTERDPRTLGLG